MHPDRTGPVLGTEAAQLPYPVVVVPGMHRVLEGSLLSNLPSFSKFQGRQTGFPFLYSHAGRPDWCKKTLVVAAAARSPPRSSNRLRHALFLIPKPSDRIPFSELPSRHTGFVTVMPRITGERSSVVEAIYSVVLITVVELIRIV
jgi:hypothetical protein